MTAKKAKRRLAAILAADAVGYSRLVEQDEAGTLAALKAHMRALITPMIAAHNGRIVKTTGDGFLGEFGSIVDAVRCAIAIQRGVAGRNAGTPPEKSLRFRIGVNLGDVVIEGADIYGDGVNIAARLEQLAEPGGILVSGTAYDQLQGKLDVPLEFSGEQNVKNLARAVRVYRVQLDGVRAERSPPLQSINRRWREAIAALLVIAVLAGGAWYFRPASEPILSARSSLAVMPFANLAGDEATGRLADGLTEDIITDLSRYREMDVIANNSTAVYKNKAVDLRQVGKELNARYVLEGSVQRDGEHIRITAQLINSVTGTHLWSERWDRPAKEFFSVQTEVANQVGSRLGGAGIIYNAEQDGARRSRPENLTAYELYLVGRNEATRGTAEGNKKSVGLLTQAVEVDPGLARAWVELASAHINSIDYGEDSQTTIPLVISAVRRAIEIDPGDAMAHAVLGRAFGMQGNFAQSEAEFDKALQLNPGNAEILAHYSGFASAFGNPERGAEAADRAIRLNPNYQVWQAWNFSYAYFIAGRYEDTLRILNRLPAENYLYYSWVLRAASYAALGQSAAARTALSDALANFPEITIEGFTGTPDWSEAERRRLAETMRTAGFPVCAKPEALANSPQLVRMPECQSK